MRILFLTATYYPSTNGVAISVKTTADMLRQKGHEVTILAPENLDTKYEEPDLIHYSSIQNPIVRDYPLPVLPLNSDIANALSANNYDIIHTHHPFHIAAFAEMFAKSNKASLVFTYHTNYEKYVDIYLKFLPKNFRLSIVKMGTDYVCKNADLVIAPSQTLQDKLEKAYPDSNIARIPTGVSFANTTNLDKNHLRKTFHIKDDKIILLSLSRLAKEKNIELAINSLALLPDEFHLVIAGSGQEEDELKDLARAKKVSKRITFLGKIEHQEVLKVMKLADIFLFPSISETQGLNLLEAMYAGLPVVAVKSDVSKEWIPDYAGLLTSNNLSSFSKAILQLNKSRSQKKSHLIEKWASNFTLESTTDILIENYQKIIQKRS